ncbi:MAG: hypothetical protein A4S12_13320 [Proteobacteria bacterium SG_bin5]|nr:hypothetical protein [Sphingomonas sp.]OQW44786.1 MAG: hypothetical protein A4S12_13320 [Proteobacteria bacterium SG_bin5]
MPSSRNGKSPTLLRDVIIAILGSGAVVSLAGSIVSTQLQIGNESVRSACQNAVTILSDETPNPNLTPAQRAQFIDDALRVWHHCAKKAIAS